MSILDELTSVVSTDTLNESYVLFRYQMGGLADAGEVASI